MFIPLQEMLESPGETHVAISVKTPMKDRPELLEKFLNDEMCKYTIL